MIINLIFSIVDFIGLVVFQVPVILVRAIFYKDSGYSLWDIPRLLFSVHPLISTAVTAALACILISISGAQQDLFRAKHEDSKIIAFFDNAGDNMYAALGRVRNIAEQREAKWNSPSTIQQFYYSYLENDTHREMRYRRHEINKKLIQERQIKLASQSNANNE